jgi:hypothetical protein
MVLLGLQGVGVAVNSNTATPRGTGTGTERQAYSDIQQVTAT